MSPSQYAKLGQLAGAASILGQVSGLGALQAGALGLTYQFHEGGALDSQPYSSGNDAQAAAYANYVFGAYFAGSGQSLSTTLAIAGAYGAKQRVFNGAYQNVAPSNMFLGMLPTANLQNIINGYTAVRNGTYATSSRQVH